MKKYYYFLTLLIFASCEEREILSPSTSQQCSNVPSFSIKGCIDNYINISKGTGSTRGVSGVKYEMTPYIFNGDTSLYIVNYDEGWQIFPNSLNAPMVLAFSNTGNLDIDDDKFKDSPLSAYLETMAFNISLGDLANLPLDSLNNCIDTIQFGLNPEVYLGNIDTLSVVTKDHLIQTKWGNNRPWNKYIKKIVYTQGGLDNGKVGCGAVAVGQYLYYKQHHGYSNLEAVSHGQYSPADSGYVFSNPDTTIWEKMAVNYQDSYADASRGDSAAVFLGEVAKSISVFYKENGTGSTPATQMQYLSSQGFDFECVDINYDTIISLLDINEPVIINIYMPGDGHACIVDGYRIENLRVTYQIQPIGGDPKTVFSDYSVKYICMNWGWDGASDDIWLIASDEVAWDVVYRNYSLNTSNPITFPANFQRKMQKRVNN